MGEGDCNQFNLCNILRKRKVIDEEQHAELKIPGTEALGGGEVICGKWNV